MKIEIKPIESSEANDVYSKVLEAITSFLVVNGLPNQTNKKWIPFSFRDSFLFLDESFGNPEFSIPIWKFLIVVDSSDRFLTVHDKQAGVRIMKEFGVEWSELIDILRKA